MDNLFLKDKIVKTEVKENIKRGVQSTCDSITVCFRWNKPLKRLIAPIDDLLQGCADAGKILLLHVKSRGRKFSDLVVHKAGTMKK